MVEVLIELILFGLTLRSHAIAELQAHNQIIDIYAEVVEPYIPSQPEIIVTETPVAAVPLVVETAPPPIAMGEPRGWYCPCFTEADVRAMISGYSWDIDTMIYIARGEAHLDGVFYFGSVNHNPGGTTDRCGFQINSIHGYDPVRLKTDPAYCIQAAYNVWLAQGYEAWEAY